MISARSDAARIARNILYVEGNYDGTVGGSFFSLLFLIRGLDKTLYRPTVVFTFEHRLIPQYQAAGARVLIRPHAEPFRWSGLARPLGRLANVLVGAVLEPVQLALLCRRLSIDAIHLNNSITRNHAWMVAARLNKIPCLTHERGINRTYSERSRALARRLAAVICISEAVRDHLRRSGVTELQAMTIPNGLDPRDMLPQSSPAAIRDEFGLGPDARLIGMVGNLKEWKGQEVVIRAAALVAANFPNVVCLLIGDFSRADEPYRLRISALIESLGLQGRVIVTGHRSNVGDYINALEILIHASIEPEPFGRVLLEGMALRKPLIASNAGAVPEIVLDGETGFLFRPGDHEQLADRLQKLLSEPALSHRLGEAGYRRLKAHFSIERNVERTTRLYEMLFHGSQNVHPAAALEPE